MRTYRLNAACTALATLLATSALSPVRAQSSLDLAGNVDLTVFSLEDLMDIEVTSVSKRAQSLRETAAAAFVITQEDIKRSGVRTLPEVLRLAPGVEVARVRANDWAVTIRGFNGRFANKLLVLIDGRSVYTPFWGGVVWDAETTLVEDIERIEVIRGPGASIWGANAVNGVINIITKSAKKTQGTLIVAEANTDGGWRTSARWGHAVRDDLSYRAYVQHEDFGASVVPSLDASGLDKWDRNLVGIRLDWEPTADDIISISGQYYDGDFAGRQNLPTAQSPFSVDFVDDGNLSGGFLQVKWDRILSVNTDLSVQASKERNERLEGGVPLHQDSSDISLDIVHTTDQGIAFQFGAGYHHDCTEVEPIEVTLAGARNLPTVARAEHLLQAFAQVEVPLFNDSVFITAGTKVEDNKFSGFEVQPTFRALWTPSQTQTFWGAYSRAVRTPARLDFDTTNQPGLATADDPLNPFPFTAAIRFVGAPTPQSLEAENLDAFELGYRTEFANGMSLDIAAYYNDYSDIIAQEVNTPFVDFSAGLPLFVLPIADNNNAAADTHGVEVSLNWPVNEHWTMAATYNYHNSDFVLDDPVLGFDLFERNFVSPKHQGQVRTHIDISDSLELDLTARYVGELERGVSDYVGLDIRLGWEFAEGLGLELVGQDLLDKQRIQFHEPFNSSPVSAFQRKVTLRLTGRF